jgi:hypothetical protein
MALGRNWISALNDLLELLHKLGIERASDQFVGGSDIRRLEEIILGVKYTRGQYDSED